MKIVLNHKLCCLKVKTFFFSYVFVSPDSSTCRFVSMQSLQLFTGEAQTLIYIPGCIMPAEVAEMEIQTFPEGSGNHKCITYIETVLGVLSCD